MRKFAYLFSAFVAFSHSPAFAADFNLTSQRAAQKSTICLSPQAISIDDAILSKIGTRLRKLKIGDSTALITSSHGRITERASTSKKNVCINKFKRTA